MDMEEKTSNELREIMRKLERRLGLLGDLQTDCCGISMAQCHAIVEIGRAKSISLTELSELLSLDNSSVSRTVDKLVKSELVRRDLSSIDRRFIKIVLTEKGLATFENIENQMNNYFLEVYNSLPIDKQNQVIESLNLLHDAMDCKTCCVK